MVLHFVNCYSRFHIVWFSLSMINKCQKQMWAGSALTCKRPSSVLCMVTHLLGWTPFVVIAVIRESSSSLFSLSFFTRLSMARLAKVSFSPPWRWHIRLWTMLKHASLLLGAFTDILLPLIRKRSKDIMVHECGRDNSTTLKNVWMSWPWI